MQTGDDSHPGAVLRVGDTVRRETGWWTPAVHDLLRYLAGRGFSQSPRVLGLDEQGREVLTYIDGESGADGWAHVVDEDGLRKFAALLRAYHDAVAGYRPASSAEWGWGVGAPAPGEIICHGDFGPWNTVWRGNTPVGILDWDLAHPGPALDDVAYALEYSAPFRDDDECLRWLRYQAPPDRIRRIRIFAEAYGRSSTEGLVEAVIHRQRRSIEEARAIQSRGVAHRPNWPTIADLESRVAWSEANRHLFEGG